jgi:hypothetical protein
MSSSSSIARRCTSSVCFVVGSVSRPLDLRAWLLAELATEKDNADAADAAQGIYEGRIDAYIRLGRHFGALKEPDADVTRLGLPN